MQQSKNVWQRAAVIGCLVAMGGVGLGGPLLPPIGPVTGTGKTLVQVEPRTEISSVNTPGDADSTFRITQPGSYYLSGNILANGKFGIEIVAAHVTIDLNGFRVGGTNGALGGIVTDGSFLEGITIKNGTVVGFDGPGVDLTRAGTGSGNNNNGAKVLDVHVSSVTGLGIRIDSGLISGCSTSFAIAGGISAIEEATISNCQVSDSSGGSGVSVNGSGHISIENVTVRNCRNGFNLFTGGSTVVRGCLAESCTEVGFDAFSATLVECVATQNGISGFDLSSCTVRNSMSEGHPVAGFIALRSTLNGCKAEGNDEVGFELDESVAIECIATGNSQLTTTRGYGFQFTDGAVAINCRAGANKFGYYVTGRSSRLEGCTAMANSTAQYQTASTALETVMVRCQAGRDSSVVPLKGFVMAGQNALIDECVSSAHSVSQFEISGSNNIVMRSRALTATGAFVVGAGNNVAPVVNLSTIGTNTNPHVNFTR